MLTTDSAEARFDFGARKDLYMAYVPFAVAAGAAALWAKKYEASVGQPAPQPDWYNSSSTTGWGFVGGSSGPSFDSFDSALSSSIGAYTASQSSSSSGGGGGFSGGDGGAGAGPDVGLGGTSFDAGTNPLVTLAFESGDGSVTITAVVPEPASLTLLGTAIAALGLSRRRKSARVG